LAAAFDRCQAERGVAAVAAEPSGMLAGFTLHAWPDAGLPLAAHVLWWDERSGWTEDPDTLFRRLDLAAGSPAVPAPPHDVRLALEGIGAVVRERVRAIRRAAWEAPVPGNAARALLARLDPLARSAARRRDAGALDRVQRAIAFAAGGHSAGEAADVARLARLPDPGLIAALHHLPARAAAPSALQARVTGVILFRCAATFPRCQPFEPCCSISTAR
jgi:hypothetical protein